MRKTPYAFWLATTFALAATAVFISIPTVPRFKPLPKVERPPLATELKSVTTFVSESPGTRPDQVQVHRGLVVELTAKLPAEALRDALTITPAVTVHWKDLIGSGTSFRIPADLKAGQSYTVALSPKGRDARKTAKRITVRVEKDEGRLDFVRAPALLERKSRQLLHFALTSVQTLALEALTVPLFAVAEATPELPADAPLAKVAEGWKARAATLDRSLAGTPFALLTADVPELKAETFYEPGLRFTERRAALPLAWRKAARGGTVLVRAVARDKGVRANTGLAALQVSDLGITLKSAPDEVLVWATRLSDGQPVANAQVYFSGGGRVALAGATGADGLLKVVDGAKLDGVSLEDGKREPADLKLSRVKRVLVAEGADAAWVELADQRGHRIQEPRAAVLDESADAKAGTVRAHLFTERGVYQPGDTVHVKVTARDLAGVEARAPRAGCKLTVKNPRDSVVRTLDGSFTPFGTVALDVPLTRHDRLGEWSLIASDSSGKQEWGRTTFRVEEFVAPRHQVDVTFTEPPVERGAPVVTQAKIQAAYRAGGPVKHGKVRWRVDLVAAPLAVPGLPGFSAGSGDEAEDALESGEATLEDDGTLPLDLPVPADVLLGRRALRVSATVLDFDGRAAAGAGQLARKPDYMVAISDPPSVHAGDDLELQLAVVEHRTGQQVQTGNLTVELQREEYAEVVKRRPEGDAYLQHETVMARVARTEAVLKDGRASARLAVAGDYGYRVQVSFLAPDGKMYRSSVALTSRQRREEPAVDPERLPVVTDRAEYRPGQTARLLMRPGRDVTAYLVTVERERVLTARVLKPSGDGSVIELPVEEAYAPGAHVAVLAMHAREAFPTHAGELDVRAPGFSHGVAPLEVRRETTGLTLALTGAGRDATARPGARHEVAVTVNGRDGKPAAAEVTLAVVDESVLSLTGYQTPDLTTLFRRRLPDLVATTETRRGLGYQTPYKYVTVKPVTGGDGASDPVAGRRRFEPVAYYRGNLVTDAQGQVKASFDLPDTMTAYRVYAIAVDQGESHGRVAAPLVVTKPLYAEIGLPRFLTAGDRGVAQVAVFNHTPNKGQVAVKVVATGGLALEPVPGAVEVAAGDRLLVPVAFKAERAGAASVSVELALGPERDAVTSPLTVRVPHVWKTEAVDGVLEGGAAEAALPAQPKGVTTLELSPLPALALTGRLRQLLEYPYGCVEQTSSGVLPLAALRGLIKDGLVPGVTLLECDGFLAPGVQRLLAMQRANGSFGYWPGSDHAHVFGSAYATFALAVAKKAGAPVPAAELDLAVAWLEKRLVNPKKSDDDDDAPSLEAQALARLALVEAGRTPPAWKPAGATAEVNALHALFSHRAGRTPEARAALDRLLAGLAATPAAEFDADTFFSPRRRVAMAALAALEVAPEAKVARDLLDQLSRDRRWGSTQEEAWTVLALARALGKVASERATVSVLGRSSERSEPGAQRTGSGSGLGRDVTMPATGSVTIDCGEAHEVSLARRSPGAVSFRLERKSPYAGADPDSTPPVRRRWERLDGPGPIRAGDLVRVTIDIEPPEGKPYLALDDPLPAGLVPLNRALATDADDAAQGDETPADQTGAEALAPDHLELRDDRVVAFHDAALEGPRRFTYVARAACAGTFRVPPAQLTPMYQPEAAVYSAPGELTIEK